MRGRRPVTTIVFVGAHLGYNAAQHPLGGGAQVGMQLLRRWSETAPFRLVVLGSGPGEGWEGFPGVAYHRISWDASAAERLTDLSVRGYARFSRRFEQGVTSWLVSRAARQGTEGVCVLHNDVCEAADFGALRKLGYAQATILHVDVVDYAASVYLRGWLTARHLALLARALGRAGLLRWCPDVVKLIFAKQEACFRMSELLVVPSADMRNVIQEAYPWRTHDDVLVVPWGAPPTRAAVDGDGQAVRAALGLPSDRPVLVALSRISPEKGQDLLLKAVAQWDRRGGSPLSVLICGAPAFIHGSGYMRKLERLARRVPRSEVRFPGYVTGEAKARLLAAADLYVFPSRHESYGLTLVEAMCGGLPVLTTSHRSATELVRPTFGRVVPSTPSGLVQGMEALLSDPEALPAMGERARDFAEKLSFADAADRLAGELVRCASRGSQEEHAVRPV